MKVIESAEILLPSKGIAEDVAFWTSEELGFRMDQIYPADDPQVVALSGHGMRMRLDTRTNHNSNNSNTSSPGVVRLLCNNPENKAFGGRTELTSPSGTRVEIADANLHWPQPPTQHAFMTRRLKDNTPWVIGRAGMHYRDLIPGRLGGAIIASHIRIPDAGPVPDKVHYHTVGFQLIFCLRGWVRLVYEDQGPAFVLAAGDCVIQPPQIRHRVLEASAGLEVVEVGVPAEHVTTIDHDMTLPTTPSPRPEREWQGQRFVRSLAADAVWKKQSWRVPGFEVRDTGIGVATGGVATVRVARPVVVVEKEEEEKEGAGNSARRTEVVTSHTSDILFTFVLSGSCTLHGENQGAHVLVDGDAYVIPPGLKTSLADCSDDLSLLEVSLPADFETTIHDDVKLV